MIFVTRRPSLQAPWCPGETGLGVLQPWVGLNSGSLLADLPLGKAFNFPKPSFSNPYNGNSNKELAGLVRIWDNSCKTLFRRHRVRRFIVILWAPYFVQMFIADRAVVTSVVVKTVVTVNLVTENFPLDAPITKWPRAGRPCGQHNNFCLSRTLTKPELALRSPPSSEAPPALRTGPSPGIVLIRIRSLSCSPLCPGILSFLGLTWASEVWEENSSTH